MSDKTITDTETIETTETTETTETIKHSQPSQPSQHSQPSDSFDSSESFDSSWGPQHFEPSEPSGTFEAFELSDMQKIILATWSGLNSDKWGKFYGALEQCSMKIDKLCEGFDLYQLVEVYNTYSRIGNNMESKVFYIGTWYCVSFHIIMRQISKKILQLDVEGKYANDKDMLYYSKYDDVEGRIYQKSIGGCVEMWDEWEGSGQNEEREEMEEQNEPEENEEREEQNEPEEMKEQNEQEENEEPNQSNQPEGFNENSVVGQLLCQPCPRPKQFNEVINTSDVKKLLTQIIDDGFNSSKHNKLEPDKLEDDKLEDDKLEPDKLEDDKLEDDKLEPDKLEPDKLESDGLDKPE